MYTYDYEVYPNIRYSVPGIYYLLPCTYLYVAVERATTQCALRLQQGALLRACSDSGVVSSPSDRGVDTAVVSHICIRTIRYCCMTTQNTPWGCFLVCSFGRRVAHVYLILPCFPPGCPTLTTANGSDLDSRSDLLRSCPCKRRVSNEQ